MREHYDIENLEQLRAIADILRVRILDLLREGPLTVTQLAERLHLAPAKVHYHVRELERVKLLQLVETREKGGILEKYYQPIAHNIGVMESLLFSEHRGEGLDILNSHFSQFQRDFVSSLRQTIEQREKRHHLAFSLTSLYLTGDESEQLAKQLNELLTRYEKRRGIEGEQEIRGLIAMHPMIEQEDSASPETATPAVTMDSSSQEVTMVTPSAFPTVDTWTVGVTSFNKADLEAVLAEGKRRSINVVGVCHFAKDVSAELADQAIERISLVGKLQASPAVREIIMRKKI